MCSWVKKGNLYHTDCGRLSKIKGRGWDFCPYCGQQLSFDRRMYQHHYYMARKAVKWGEIWEIVSIASIMLRKIKVVFFIIIVLRGNVSLSLKRMKKENLNDLEVCMIVTASYQQVEIFSIYADCSVLTQF